jgi:hypothetical protein
VEKPHVTKALFFPLSISFPLGIHVDKNFQAVIHPGGAGHAV